MALVTAFPQSVSMLGHSAIARWIFWPYLMIVLALTLTPFGGNGGSHDKLAHMLAFFILASLALMSWGRERALTIALSLSLLAAAIELLQGLPIVARTPDLWDWVADNLGILLAFAAGVLWPYTIKRVCRRHQKPGQRLVVHPRR